MNNKIKYLILILFLIPIIYFVDKKYTNINEEENNKNMIKPLIISIKGATLEKNEKELIKKINPFGFLLAAHNMKNKKQIKKLIMEIKETLQRDNIFFAIDQEGGSVNRLKNIEDLDKFESKSISYFGDLYKKNKKLATIEIKEQASIYAKIMKDIGFNLDFAPVVDLYNKNDMQATTTISKRTISSDPEIITVIAKTFNIGLKENNVFGCLKHFPGLGSEYTDTHINVSIINKNFKKMLKEDIIPFKKLSKEFMFIMVSLAVYKDIDDKNPAIFSKKIIKILKNNIGFKGFILTDGLDMEALKKYSKVERVIKSLKSGVDIAMPIYYSIDDLLIINEKIPKDIIISFNKKLNKLLKN